jgi:hypothetical protein
MKNPLYHTTGIWAAARILETRTFNLTAAVNTTEQGLKGRKNKLFYLSTSRIMANQYRQVVGFVNLTLELNRDWFEQRYQAKPVDYWGPEYREANKGQTEKEERIYSEKSTISMSSLSQAITGIFIYVDVKQIDKARDSRHLRTILIKAKQNQIPVYFFTDKQAYFVGNTRRTQPLSVLIGLLETHPPTYWGRLDRDWTQPYRELFWKTKKEELSKDAKRLADNLNYHSYNGDTLRSLEADLHNNKANVIEMRKMALVWKKLKISTIKEFHDYLKDKWVAIYKATK